MLSERAEREVKAVTCPHGLSGVGVDDGRRVRHLEVLGLRTDTHPTQSPPPSRCSLTRASPRFTRHNYYKHDNPALSSLAALYNREYRLY